MIFQQMALHDASAGHLRLQAHLLAMTLVFIDLMWMLGALHMALISWTSTLGARINDRLCLNQGRIHGTGGLLLQTSDFRHPLPHSKLRFKQLHPLQVLQPAGGCMQAP